MFARAVEKVEAEQAAGASVRKTGLANNKIIPPAGSSSSSFLGKGKGSSSSSQQQTDIKSSFFHKSGSSQSQQQTQRRPSTSYYGSSQRSQVKPSLKENFPANADPFVSKPYSAQGTTASSISLNQTSQDSSTSSRSSGLRSTLDTYSNSFQESEAPPPLGQIHVSKMTNLADMVYFDENDFDDDLNFDDEPIFNPTLKAAVATLPPPEPVLPANPPPATPTNKNIALNSSQPLPWSSSPIPLYKPGSAQTRRNLAGDTSNQTGTTGTVKSSVASSYKPSFTANASSTSTRTDKVKVEGGPPSRLNKAGRKLPWVKEEEELAAQQRSTVSSVAKTSYRSNVPATPNRMVGTSWETTASTLKAARTELKTQVASTKRSFHSGNTSTDTIDVEQPRKKIKERIATVFLSDEQQRVISLVKDDMKSVFFTGSAGTGKSVLLREIIVQLRKMHAREPDRVQVTASTGLAACNIGGMTLHSFGGIGLGKESVSELVKKIKRNTKAKNRWLRTKVLIIDEISMVDGDLFDKLENIARVIRNNGKPFGGIQLIITGDFFQLPPVPDGGRAAAASKFAFEAQTWSVCINHTIGLTQVFRQKDPVFAGMLNEMRLGKLNTDSIEAFRKLSRPVVYEDGIEPTELFPTRQEVDGANRQKMQRLTGEIYTYNAVDGGSADPSSREKLLANVMAPKELQLKKNAQVMLIKNFDEQLVNGSLGRIVGFMTEETWTLLGGDHDSLENIRDADELLAKSLHSAEEEDDDPLTKRNKRLAKQLSAKGDQKKWPLVQFSLANGTFRQMLVHPEIWKVEQPNGEISASRLQLPLILAWALSIHKAQGQTLERVKVDLGRVFEKGQAYVALSRATCQEGLQILRFDPVKVMAHDKVRDFYHNLYSAHDAAQRAKAALPSAPKWKVDDDYEEEERAYQAHS